MNLWLFGHVVLNLWQLLIMKFVFIRNTMTIANRSVNVHRSFGKFLHTISKKRNHLYECKKNIIKKKKLNCRLEKVYWAVPYTSRTLILLFFLQQEGNMLVQQDNAYSTCTAWWCLTTSLANMIPQPCHLLNSTPVIQLAYLQILQYYINKPSTKGIE